MAEFLHHRPEMTRRSQIGWIPKTSLGNSSGENLLFGVGSPESPAQRSRLRRTGITFMCRMLVRGVRVDIFCPLNILPMRVLGLFCPEKLTNGQMRPAHRALIARKLKGLEDIISFTSVHWHMGEYGACQRCHVAVESLDLLLCILRY